MLLIETILFLLFMIALALLITGPFALVRAVAYRRVIRAEIAKRGGDLVRVDPWWIFRKFVDGWHVGRRIRFQWIDGQHRTHVSECEFMYFMMESLFRRGRFRWLGDVSDPRPQSAEPGGQRGNPDAPSSNC